MKTSIIIPVLNKLEYTQGCIQSIQAYTPEEHEILFVDNGSTDGTHEYLQKLCAENQNYILIRNEKNLGFPKAVNQGIRFSTGGYVLLLNNDVIVSPEWLKGLIECIEHKQDVGIVGARTNNISGLQQFSDGAYSSPFEFVEFARNFRKSMRKNYLAWWRIVGFCMLIKREVIDKIGLFDEQFTPGNFEDDDFCIRAWLAGYTNYICGDVFVHHFGSVSHDNLDYNSLLALNQAKFRAKWEKWKRENSTVSCCMIVKNEEARIGGCLDKIIPLVDEVVVVDTGSTDKTVEIVKSKDTNKVKLYDFKWCDDFSAARNFANSKATSAWIYSLDADEIVEQIDRSQLWPVTVYGYETRNYSNQCNWKGWKANKGESEYEEGIGWFPSLKIRLFPNDKRFYWSYPVHEVIEPSAYDLGVERKISPDPVHHIGKIDLDWDLEKGQKYYQYLQKRVADKPDDTRHLEALATQAQNMGRFDEALGLWEKYMSFSVDDDSKFNALLNKGHVLACLGRNEEGLTASQAAWDTKPDSREAAMNTAILSFRLGHYEKARDISKEVREKHPDYPIPEAVFNAATKRLQGDKEATI